jgi:hypothetical protein
MGSPFYSKYRGRSSALFSFFVLAFLAAHSLDASEKTPRGEFNISVGLLLHNNPSIIYGFGYYLVPRFIEVDANMAVLAGETDDRGRELPLSANLSLNLPLKKIVPFVTGGAGLSPRGTFVKNLGAGIKAKLGRRMGLLVEYKYFTFTSNVSYLAAKKITYNYIGVGLNLY